MPQRRFLTPVFVEVVGGEPTLETLFPDRPFGIEHGEPGGVAGTAFDDHVLAENSFEGETEAAGGALRGVIEHVALPFIATVAHFFEDVPRHQVHGFGGGAGALEFAGEDDPADFDDALCGVDPHPGGNAGGATGGAVDDGEVKGIVAGGDPGEVGVERRALRERTAVHVLPEALVGGAASGLPERVAVTGWIERFHDGVGAFEAKAFWVPCGFIVDWGSDGQ